MSIVFASPVIVSVVLLLAYVAKHIGAEWLDRKMYRSLEDPLPQKFMVIPPKPVVISPKPVVISPKPVVISPKPVVHNMFDLSWVGDDVIVIVWEEHEVIKKCNGTHSLFDFSDVYVENFSVAFEECYQRNLVYWEEDNNAR